MTLPLIDPTVFAELKSAAGDEFVDELVQTFLEEAPPLLSELRAAHAEGANERFERAAHSLKSNAQTFGATALGDKARTLEIGGLPAETAALFELEEAYVQAAAALEALRHG